MMGYFPTYSLVNIISCQIWEKANAALPDLAGQFERGEFMPLREWLRENLHQYGRKVYPGGNAQGSPAATSRGPYVRYLYAKLRDIYQIDDPR